MKIKASRCVLIVVTIGMLAAFTWQGNAQGVLGVDNGGNVPTQMSPAAVINQPPIMFTGNDFRDSVWVEVPYMPVQSFDLSAPLDADAISPIPEPSSMALIIVAGLYVLCSRFLLRFTNQNRQF